MKKLEVGIFWFTNDLRLHDNPALNRASMLVDQLLCIYVIDRPWRVSHLYTQAGSSQNSDQFLRESLVDLHQSLKRFGQRLIVIESETVPTLNALIEQLGVTHVIRSRGAGFYENRAWNHLIKANGGVDFCSIESHTLFDETSLPFEVAALPKSFTKFKHSVSDVAPLKSISKQSYIPPPPQFESLSTDGFLDEAPSKSMIQGGEAAALIQLNDYFSSEKPMFYKEVRNNIDGWENSSKFSPWLSNGSLSVREVVAVLSEYEQAVAANESTYWIYFELLWREYFQWYARKLGSRLFSFTGIKNAIPLTSYYPERFQKWVNGSTPYPLVNACMNELKTTGYLSNRGRQIVASCLVNELAIDWRFGAAYFEQVLIDYDVASNWGNWQYLAGVGADVRSKRHFNLEKQERQFDPDRRYINLWNGDAVLEDLDSVDAVDWPIV